MINYMKHVLLNCDRKGCARHVDLIEPCSEVAYHEWGHYGDRTLCPECNTKFKALTAAFWDGKNIIVCNDDKEEKANDSHTDT